MVYKIDLKCKKNVYFQAFADLHGCLDLLSATNTYIESHFSEVLDCDEFYGLTPEQVT